MTAMTSEREAFEAKFSKAPFEFSMIRYPERDSAQWPGQYRDYATHCAWEAWQARAHLSQPAQAVAWMTDAALVCGDKITRDSEVAEAWKARGWNVWPLSIPASVVSIPSPWEELSDDDAGRRSFGMGWNACRKSMLHADITAALTPKDSR